MILIEIEKDYVWGLYFMHWCQVFAEERRLSNFTWNFFKVLKLKVLILILYIEKFAYLGNLTSVLINYSSSRSRKRHFMGMHSYITKVKVLIYMHIFEFNNI